MSNTTSIKDTAIGSYERQLEREALQRIQICSTGYSRAAHPFIVEHRSDEKRTIIRTGWRKAMKQEQERWAIIHLVQRGDDRRPIMITEKAPHMVAADADGCAIAVCWPHTVTWELLETMLAEAKRCELQWPIHVYASACTAPIAPDLYRLYHVHDPWAPPGLRRHQRDELEAPMQVEVVEGRIFNLELTATATVRQRRQIRAQTLEEAVAAAIASADDHVWEYTGVNETSIEGTAI